MEPGLRADDPKYAHVGRRSAVDRPSNTLDSAPPPSNLHAATRTEFFGEEVKRRLLLGAYTLSAR
jgi:hypothetical protein